MLLAVSIVAFANLIGNIFNVQGGITMSTALKACVILEETEHELIFQTKCEKCGALQQKVFSRPVSPYMTKNWNFRCSKCGANNVAQIRGDN